MGKEIENQLGIPSNGIVYHKIKVEQDLLLEGLKTLEFLSVLSKKYDFSNMKFINYGDTELVYVAENAKKLHAILVSQPATKFGVVKNEFENLKLLGEKNPNTVVVPTDYVAFSGREAYITPYLKQARCVACDERHWGVYKPEPHYMFQPFTQQQAEVVNSCIVAQLIKMYDANKGLGIADCKIGGGDFILEKDWDNMPLNENITLQSLKLIAARKLVPIQLSDYIEVLKDEFSRKTDCNCENGREKATLVNCSCRQPMTKGQIARGIELGFNLRKNASIEKNQTDKINSSLENET